MSRLFFALALVSILIIPQAWGATNSPYPNPYRQTAWNSMTDSMHTLGQDPQQAKKTRARLHNRRTNARLHSIHQANKAKRQAWVNSK